MTKNLIPAAHDVTPRAPPYPSARWLVARGLHPPVEAGGRWKVTIALDVVDPRITMAGSAINTRLHILIECFEWSVFFCHGSGSSWIRVTNVPRVHERDDFELLPHITDLRGLGTFIQRLEQRFQLRFRRQHAAIHTNLIDADQKLLLWVVAAL
jgi:hypothetical protein